MTTPGSFAVTVKTAVWRGERLLRLRERDGAGVVYDLPGGRMERGEAVEAGLARELREELGAGIARRSPLPIQLWSAEHRGNGVLALLYEVELDPPDPPGGSEPDVLATYMREVSGARLRACAPAPRRSAPVPAARVPRAGAKAD